MTVNLSHVWILLPFGSYRPTIFVDPEVPKNFKRTLSIVLCLYCVALSRLRALGLRTSRAHPRKMHKVPPYFSPWEATYLRTLTFPFASQLSISCIMPIAPIIRRCAAKCTPAIEVNNAPDGRRRAMSHRVVSMDQAALFFSFHSPNKNVSFKCTCNWRRVLSPVLCDRKQNIFKTFG